VRYTEWVDAVLTALDRAATADGTAALVGVGWNQILESLGLPINQETQSADFGAGRDLELMRCAEGLDQLRVKVTPAGQHIARAGGLRKAWPSLFQQYVPLEEDRAVLAKVVETGVTDAVAYASTQMVELKEAMRLAGYLGDQGSAIATAKRLQRIGCIHDPLITMGPDGYCQARPSYVGIVIATEQVATEERALLDQLVSEWETTSVDVKESLGLDTERQKAEFCKDVLALANTRVSGRRFLVIGFNNTSRAFTTSIDPSVDQHRMESVLSAYCNPVPRIEYRQIAMDGGTAGLIEVLSDPGDLPYTLSRDSWKLKANSAFVRHNTQVALAEGEELTRLVAEGERSRSLRQTSALQAKSTLEQRPL